MNKIIFYLFLLISILNISCDKEVSVSPEDQLISKSILFIDSNPDNVRIFVDGRNSGQRTPDTIKWLEKGPHLITLKSDVCKDSNYLITIDDDPAAIFFDYTTNPTMRGNLYVDSSPRGAEIFLNDSSTGLQTPQYLRSLFPGEYEIKYKLTGYWDLEVKAKVTSERTVTVDKSLLDSTIWVHLTASNIGLPTNWFNDVAIESGYIKWFASEGEGLIRWDDRELTVYNTSNSAIPTNFINSIEVVDNGLWLATDKGAAFFSGGIFTVYNSANSPLPDKIITTASGTGGKVWVASYDQGVFLFNAGTWTRYHKGNAPLRTNYMASLYVDKVNDIVWMGTAGEGIQIFDGVNWVRVYNSLPSPRVDAICSWGSNIYAGTSSHTKTVYGAGNNGEPGAIKTVNYVGGLSVLNGTWSTNKLTGKDIVALVPDAQGVIWFSDYGTGLGRWNNGTFLKFTAYNTIKGLAIDGSGHKWLATASKGIVKYKGN